MIFERSLAQILSISRDIVVIRAPIQAIRTSIRISLREREKTMSNRIQPNYRPYHSRCYDALPWRVAVRRDLVA